MKLMINLSLHIIIETWGFLVFCLFFFYHMVDAATVFTAPVSQRSWVQIPYGPEIFPGPIFNYSFQ